MVSNLVSVELERVYIVGILICPEVDSKKCNSYIIFVENVDYLGGVFISPCGVNCKRNIFVVPVNGLYGYEPVF